MKGKNASVQYRHYSDVHITFNIYKKCMYLCMYACMYVYMCTSMSIPVSLCLSVYSLETRFVHDESPLYPYFLSSVPLALLKCIYISRENIFREICADL